MRKQSDKWLLNQEEEQMKMKRCMALILSAVLAVTGLPPSVAAAEPVKTLYADKQLKMTGLLQDLPDHDVLFEAYVNGLFLGAPSVSTYGEHGASKLEGKNRKAYEMFQEQVHKIAMGETESSQVTLPLAELGITKKSWTAEELGVSEIVTGNSISQEAMSALGRILMPDLRTVLNYLLIDCPWDLYWYDKTDEISINEFEYMAMDVNGAYQLCLGESFTELIFYLPVAKEYRASLENPYVLNKTLVGSAKAAADYAKQIVAECESFRDFEKLHAYREKICELVSYNQEALETKPSYGNPWQLIWVFDKDPSTNVVCEGYAKAFQYLCDMSDFQNGSVACYTVSGNMDGGTGAGAHMWNIVTMEDQKNYIVDVTNCDEGTIGAPDKLFLSGASKSASEGYTVEIPGFDQPMIIYYTYEENMPEMYGNILSIAKDNYKEPHGNECPAHRIEAVAEKAATCLEAGNTAYFTCRACQKVYRDSNGANEISLKDTVVQALGHKIGVNWEYDADSHFHTCGRCNAKTDLAQHDLQWVITLEPTQTAEGKRQQECTVCNYQGKQETIPPTGHEHTYGGIYEKDESGHWKTCSICGEAQNAQAHTYGAWSVKTEASCKKPGVEARACEACGYEETRSYTAEHTYGAWDIVTAQTCTQNGIRRRICSECEYEQTEIIEADGRHDWEDTYTIDRNATCTEEGSGHVSCKICGQTQTKILPATGHALNRTVEKKATCTAGGNAEFYTCTVCGKRFWDDSGKREISQAETTDTAKAPHSYTAAVVPATTEQNGSVYHKCSSCGMVSDTKIISRPDTAELSDTSYVYSKSAKIPSVRVYDCNGELISNDNYTVSYVNNRNVGTATVRIAFLGNYSGTMTRTFTIRPKGTSVTRLKAISKGFTVSWKKNKTQTTGYQIQYATSSKFKGAKTKTYQNATKAKITKLKAKKKYYVRIRTYKTVGSVKIYSDWSKAKAVTVKK